MECGFYMTATVTVTDRVHGANVCGLKTYTAERCSDVVEQSASSLVRAAFKHFLEDVM